VPLTLSSETVHSRFWKKTCRLAASSRVRIMPQGPWHSQRVVTMLAASSGKIHPEQIWQRRVPKWEPSSVGSWQRTHEQRIFLVLARWPCRANVDMVVGTIAQVSSSPLKHKGTCLACANVGNPPYTDITVDSGLLPTARTKFPDMSTCKKVDDLKYYFISLLEPKNSQIRAGWFSVKFRFRIDMRTR